MYFLPASPAKEKSPVGSSRQPYQFSSLPQSLLLLPSEEELSRPPILAIMSAQAQMRALLDQLMGTARDGEFARPAKPRAGVGQRRGRRAA